MNWIPSGFFGVLPFFGLCFAVFRLAFGGTLVQENPSLCPLLHFTGRIFRVCFPLTDLLLYLLCFGQKRCGPRSLPGFIEPSVESWLRLLFDAALVLF